MIPRVGYWVLSDSLDRMIRSGRFQGAEDRMRGEFLLNRMVEGEIKVAGVFDRHEDALEAMLAQLVETAARSPVRLGLHHDGSEVAQRQFLERAAACVRATQTYLCP